MNGRRYPAPQIRGAAWHCSCGIQRKTDRARATHLQANPEHTMRWGKALSTGGSK